MDTTESLEKAIELGAAIKRLREEEAVLAQERQEKEEALLQLIQSIEAVRGHDRPFLLEGTVTQGRAGQTTMREKVLGVLAAYPTRSFNAEELMPFAEVDNIDSLRTCLAILNQNGLVNKVQKGRYQRKKAA